jgi:hypothetical protein
MIDALPWKPTLLALREDLCQFYLPQIRFHRHMKSYTAVLEGMATVDISILFIFLIKSTRNRSIGK